MVKIVRNGLVNVESLGYRYNFIFINNVWEMCHVWLCALFPLVIQKFR